MSKSKGFEDQLQKLEEIREQLESGEVTLDESIRLYEAGVKQLKLCQNQLSKYEAKIKELTPLDEEEDETDEES